MRCNTKKTGYVGKDAAPADGDAAPPLELTVVSELVRQRAALVHYLKGGGCFNSAHTTLHYTTSPPTPHHTTNTTNKQHDASEYGANVSPGGRHSGGPFVVAVPAKARVEELRRLIAVRCCCLLLLFLSFLFMLLMGVHDVQRSISFATTPPSKK
jgi:hypothetical protein